MNIFKAIFQFIFLSLAGASTSLNNYTRVKYVSHSTSPLLWRGRERPTREERSRRGAAGSGFLLSFGEAGRGFFLFITISILFTSSCTKAPQKGYANFKIYQNDFPLYNPLPVRLTDGSFVTVQGGKNEADSNFYFKKFDSHGNYITTKSYNFYEKDINTIAQVGNGFFIEGGVGSYPAFYVARFDADMNMLWDSSYNLGIYNAFNTTGCVSTDGNILVAIGEHPGSLFSANLDVIIAKTNASTGALMQLNLVEGKPTQIQFQPCSIYERSDGLYINGYYFYSNNGNAYLGSSFCMSITEAGAINWLNYQPIPNADSGVPYINGYNIAENNSGPIATAGITNIGYFLTSYITTDNYLNNLIGAISLISYDPATGKIVDSVNLDMNNETKDNNPFIHPTPDNGYIIAATGNFYSQSPTIPTTIELIKTDAHFNVQWRQTFNPGGANPVAYGLFVLSDGYEIIGVNNYIRNGNTQEDIFFMRTDLEGNIAPP